MDVVVRDVPVLCTMDEGEGPLGLRFDVAIGIHGGRIAWIGPAGNAPSAPVVRSAKGAVVVPGLIDCHTHSVWAGTRSEEWRRRIAGETYAEILQSGGGILSTVRQTRAASTAKLLALATRRLIHLKRRGVTRIEVKSGYGLSVDHEVRLLRVARAAAERAGMAVRTTFLGAHAIPEEWRHDRAGYVNDLIENQIPAAAPVADAVDVYVDRGAFTVEEGHSILSAGRANGLSLRIHAEQNTYTGAAAMAAALGAESADHLERIDDAGIAAMARSGTKAVLLPGAMAWLRDQAPPVDRLREAGVPMAVATDLNPGSSPFFDPWTVLALACAGMRLRPEEALRGMTRVAADVLGWADAGRIRVGSPAELVAVSPPPGEPCTPSALLCNVNGNRVRWVISGDSTALLR